MADLELWYDRPATVWTEALPLGNGRLGAMVFGDPVRELVQLNESTFFSGGPYSPINPEAYAHLAEVRTLIFSRRYAEAEALAHRHLMAKPHLQMSFQPIGDVWLDFGHKEGVSDYRRSLDIDSAVARTRYVHGGVTHRREVFASPVSGVLVCRVTTDTPGSLSFDVGLQSAQPGALVPAGTGRLAYLGTNRGEHGIEGALRFGFQLTARAEGGEMSGTAEVLSIRNADSALLLIDAATSFRRYDDVGGDPAAAIEARLASVAGLSFDQIREDHVAEHRRLFRSFSISLGGHSASPRPTNERVSAYTSSSDPALAALYTQFGRYLLISSSRPGTEPANLQGLWNAETKPPWGSKYTTNINLEMNYWLPDPSNLRACFDPLIRLVEDVAETGAAMAGAHYGARGWVLHHNTDLWRATGPVDGPQWGLWPMGGAWLCAQLWDHYQFWPEPQLLERIYPLMRGAAEFLLDYLVVSPQTGALVTVPSLSPENVHPHGASICAGPAMDNQIIRDLFTGVIDAATALRRDAGLIEQLAGSLERLNPDLVGRGGQLQEWEEDWDLDAPEPNHRHVSHLYGLYPSWQIDLDRTPDLAQAARTSLEMRGDEATGWGIGWRLNLWARLRDGEHSASVLRRLLSPDRTYPNLFDSHPPFQIDGNFGGAAGIIEMLVQSRPGWLLLLPALPNEWPEGEIAGVRARGGLAVDLTWAAGVLVRVSLRADLGQSTEVVYGEARRAVELLPGVGVTLVLRAGRLEIG